MFKKKSTGRLFPLKFTITRARLLELLSESTKKIETTAQQNNISESVKKPVMLLCAEVDFLRTILEKLDYDGVGVDCYSVLTTEASPILDKLLDILLCRESLGGIPYCEELVWPLHGLNSILLDLSDNIDCYVSANESLLQKEELQKSLLDLKNNINCYVSAYESLQKEKKEESLHGLNSTLLDLKNNINRFVSAYESLLKKEEEEEEV
jgi:hypothetical protein